MAVIRTFIVKTTDQLGNFYEKSLSNGNPAATFEQVDTAARALVGLSTNNYFDTVVRDERSVNAELSE